MARFRDGFAIGIAVSGTLTVLLLFVLMPTSDVRIRLWILLDMPGDPSLHVALWLAAFVGSSLTAFALGRARGWELLGAGAASLAAVSSLSAGAYQWVPAIESTIPRVVVLLSVVGAAGAIVWRLGTAPSDSA